MKITIFASGQLGLTCLKKIQSFGYEIEYIFTDKGSVAIKEYCDENGLNCYAGNPNSSVAMTIVSNCNSTIFFSINYLFLFKHDFLKLAPETFLNIHGSLLPRYRGRAPHVWAIINGEIGTGITIHKIDENCDTGDILVQETVEITSSDTGGSMLEKYAKLYPGLIQKALSLVSSGKATYLKQQDSMASYYPKRTPEDGLISWDWSFERIRNWVRAQTKPYPGAFTVKEGQKIIIWSVEKKNATTIMTGGDLIFSCADGEVVVRDYETLTLGV
jgi:methionyl-tRNA formyltransferase